MQHRPDDLGRGEHGGAVAGVSVKKHGEPGRVPRAETPGEEEKKLSLAATLSDGLYYLVFLFFLPQILDALHRQRRGRNIDPTAGER